MYAITFDIRIVKRKEKTAIIIQPSNKINKFIFLLVTVTKIEIVISVLLYKTFNFEKNAIMRTNSKR